MQRRWIDRLLLDRGDTFPSGLEAGFGASVLARAKQFKVALLRHRRWLMVSSLIALALAVLISVRMGNEVEVIPPPLDAFRAPAFSAPQPNL